MKNVLRALSYFRPDASRLAMVFLLMLASIGLNILKPWPLALIVDSVLGNKPLPGWCVEILGNFGQTSLIAGLSGLIFALHFGQGGLQALQNFLTIRIGLRGLTRVRSELFAQLQRLSLRFHQGANAGDLIYRATWDSYSFQTLFQQGLVTFVTAFLSLLVMTIVMARINFRLTLFALATVPLLVIAIRFFGRRMNERTNAAQQADSKVTSLVQQTIASMQLIQSYTREQIEKDIFQKQITEAEQRRVSQHGGELLYWFSIAVVFGLGVAGMTWLGIRELLVGKLTLGELLVFLAYLAQLYEPLNQLSHVGATVAGARAGTQRIFEVLDTPEQIKNAADPIKPTPRLIGRIECVNVFFAYENKHNVLSDLSLFVAPGESVAIIGPSGAGKTTLLNLLPRFFDPTKGVIKIDGFDLRQLDLNYLRSNIALVLQEPILLSATIAENIAYGKPGASRAEVEAAAMSASADLFIRKLPHGYDTMIGEGASRLSVGEKQRINLARAFLKDAPILLLDEPTSALDAENEELVVASLQKLMQGRTTLISAHRLATIRRMDRIFVLENGRLLETGTPEQLQLSGGYYARMVGNQG
jgi:ATP-binding cassette subfamily B protein